MPDVSSTMEVAQVAVTYPTIESKIEALFRSGPLRRVKLGRFRTVDAYLWKAGDYDSFAWLLLRDGTFVKNYLPKGSEPVDGTRRLRTPERASGSALDRELATLSLQGRL